MDFALTHPDGSTVRGICYAAPGKGRRPAVIISHGFNGCCAALHGRGEAFNAAGIHCFLFDFRGGGEGTTSDGRLSEMMTHETECADLKLVLEYVRRQGDVDPDRVFLLGESQGGFISTLVTEDMPGAVRGLILWFPALMIPDASRERLARGIDQVFGIRLSPDFDRLAAKADPWTGMKGYHGRVLLIHGDRDAVVPVEISQRAASLFPHAEVMIIPGAGHGFGGNDLQTALDASVQMILDDERDP